MAPISRGRMPCCGKVDKEYTNFDRALCLLCRQLLNDGSTVLDLYRIQPTAPKCENPCSITTGPKIWSHQLCYALLERSYKSGKPTFNDLQKFADAVKPLYPPPDKEIKDAASSWEGVFSQYAKPMMEDTFRQELFERLPAEIQITISNSIGPCWYLIVLGETRRLIELLRSPSGSQCERLSLTKEVYITRIDYQGGSYISRISNVPPEPQSLDHSDRQHLKLPVHIRDIVLSTYHVGVREVQFLDQTSNPSPDGSPWYEVLKVPDSLGEVRVICDGLFVRSIQVRSDAPDSAPRAWRSIHPPEYKPWNVYRFRDGRRLDYIKLDADVQGLIVQTTLGRTATFGLYPQIFERRDYEFLPLVKDGDGLISGFFHDGLDPGVEHISELGVECNQVSQAKATKAQPAFDTYDYEQPKLPSAGFQRIWYMTKARLEGLLRARVCTRREGWGIACTGLLLYYNSGRVESVGQFRWDYDVSHEVSSPICFKAGNRIRYFVDIQSTSTVCMEIDEWQMVPDKGTIVWWFGRFGDIITIHDD
ncbi:hypothetical protein FQN49_003178 [Arthroderma sp. PD_2]|nr:hypothetical protein FQN49_003178 [Arthroderma sp. PD_2]